MNRLKETIFRNQKYQPNLQGQSFENLCRQATAKTLKEPDRELNAEIELAINDKDSGAVDPQELVNVLKKRLRSDNPHKQYLAVLLTKHILSKCTTRVKAENVFAEILFEVAIVAANPSKPETPEAKTAKKAAFDVLRSNGKAGQAAFRAVTGLGYSQHWNPETQLYTSAPLSARSGGKPSEASPRAEPAPVEAANAPPGGEGQASPGGRASTIKRLGQATQLAKSHTEVFQDMLMHTEPGQLEDGLIQELLGELEGLKVQMPVLIQRLSGKEGPDTEALLGGALESLDGVNTALTLYAAVKDGRANEAQEPKAGPQEGGQASAFPDLSEACGSPSGAMAPGDNAQPVTSAQSVDPFGLSQLEDGLVDAFADLAVQRAQEVTNPFESVVATPAEPTSNPFVAASPPVFPVGANPFGPAAPLPPPAVPRQLNRQISAPEARMQGAYQDPSTIHHAAPPMGTMKMGGPGAIVHSNPRSLSRSATQTRAPSPTLSMLDPFAELAATPLRTMARGKPMVGQSWPHAQGGGSAMIGVPPCTGSQPMAKGMAPGPVMNGGVEGGGNMMGGMAGFRPPSQQSFGLNMAGGHEHGGSQWG